MPKRKKKPTSRAASKTTRSEPSPGQHGRGTLWQYALAGVALTILAICSFVVWQQLQSDPKPLPSAAAKAESAAEAGIRPSDLPARPDFATAGGDSPEQVQISKWRSASFDVAEGVVRALPNSPDAIALLGTVHHRHGNDSAAIELWHTCLKLDPDFADAHQMLGTRANERGDFEEGERHLKRALELDPQWKIIPMDLADALVHLGKFQEAIKVLTRYQQTYPREAAVWCKLGEAHQCAKDLDKAKECLQTAQQLDPNNADACFALSIVLRSLGQDEEAAKAADTFKRLDAKRDQTTRQLRPQFDDTWRMKTTLVNTHMTAARIFMKHRQAQAMEDHCRQAASLSPEDVESREMLCSLYVPRGNVEAALRIRKELCKISAQDPRQWLRVGILSHQLGRLDEAEKAFRQLIAVAPQQAEGYLTLAQILMKPDKDPKEAVQLARKGIELAPTADNYHIMATVYENVGDLAAAKKTLRKAVQLEPHTAKYQSALRRLEFGQKP